MSDTSSKKQKLLYDNSYSFINGDHFFPFIVYVFVMFD